MTTSNVGLLPRHGLHEASSRHTLSGWDAYFGRHASPEGRNSYDRVTGEWLASGRRALDAIPDTMTV